jgi:hypothetical protein
MPIGARSKISVCSRSNCALHLRASTSCVMSSTVQTARLTRRGSVDRAGDEMSDKAAAVAARQLHFDIEYLADAQCRTRLLAQRFTGRAVGMEDKILLADKSSRRPAKKRLGARVAAVHAAISRAHHGNPRMLEDSLVLK